MVDARHWLGRALRGKAHVQDVRRAKRTLKCPTTAAHKITGHFLCGPLSLNSWNNAEGMGRSRDCAIFDAMRKTPARTTKKSALKIAAAVAKRERKAKAGESASASS